MSTVAATVMAEVCGIAVDLCSQAVGSEVRLPRTVPKVFLVAAVVVADRPSMRQIYFLVGCPHPDSNVRRIVWDRRGSPRGSVANRR